MSDTPDTDNQIGMYGYDDAVSADFARKLERERDEARAIISHDKKLLDEIDKERQAALVSLESTRAERDQLRKVADELAHRLASIAEYHRGTPMSESAQKLLNETYNSLPHVIERNTAK